MKISSGLSAALLMGAFGSFGCEGGNTVTGVDSVGGTRYAEGSRRAAASATDLSGIWSGTIAFRAYSNIEGDTSPSPCDGVASIAVTLRQNGDNLAGQFQTGCGGVLSIRGFVNGANLSGSLDGSTGPGFGRIFGTVTSNHIRFRTVQLTDDEDDNGRDNDGDAAYTSSDVELHRQPASEREVPLLAAGERSPRALPARR
jgi:hypothetical protein